MRKNPNEGDQSRGESELLKSLDELKRLNTFNKIVCVSMIAFLGAATYYRGKFEEVMHKFEICSMKDDNRTSVQFCLAKLEDCEKILRGFSDGVNSGVCESDLKKLSQSLLEAQNLARECIGDLGVLQSDYLVCRGKLDDCQQD